jgi:hypothetical protein
MFFVQMCLFEATECSSEAPILYVWLAVQVGLFYFLVAYGLAAWGSYVCWDAEKEEALAKKAVSEYLLNQYSNQLMIANGNI